MNWLHKLLNPHCSHCIDELREKKICSSCEILKMELSRVRDDNDRLLDRILEKPVQPIESDKPANITKPANVPWRVRQQMLEEQDRVKANLLKNAPKPSQSIESLEQELGVDDAVREGNA